MYRFILLMLLSGPVFAGTQVACVYPDKASHEMTQQADCGELDEQGRLRVSSGLLDRVYWSKYGLQCIYVEAGSVRGWYYINQNGLGRWTAFASDNDCAPFNAGLAVGLSQGKVVFFNQAMRVVRNTEYRWASSFYKGYAKVCSEAPQRIYDNDGEHYRLRGGRCGFVDRAFLVVVPINYRFEATPRPSDRLH